MDKRKYIDCPSCSSRIISRRKSRQRKLRKKKNVSVNELCLCVPKATFIFSPFPWRLVVLNVFERLQKLPSFVRSAIRSKQNMPIENSAGRLSEYNNGYNTLFVTSSPLRLCQPYLAFVLTFFFDFWKMISSIWRNGKLCGQNVIFLFQWWTYANGECWKSLWNNPKEFVGYLK